MGDVRVVWSLVILGSGAACLAYGWSSFAKRVEGTPWFWAQYVALPLVIVAFGAMALGTDRVVSMFNPSSKTETDPGSA